ncbi:MAG: hypothetical protein ACOC16_00275 [Nanoarchaeota archaeon]
MELNIFKVNPETKEQRKLRKIKAALESPAITYKEEESNSQNINTSKSQFQLPSFFKWKDYISNVKIPNINFSNIPLKEVLIYSSIGYFLLLNISQSKQIKDMQNEFHAPQVVQSQLDSQRFESLEANLSNSIKNIENKTSEAISSLESRLNKQNHFLDRKSMQDYNGTPIKYPVLISSKNETLTYNTKTNQVSLFNTSMPLGEAFDKIITAYHKEDTSPNNMNIQTLFELAVDSYFSKNTDKKGLSSYVNQLKSTFKPTNDKGYAMLLTLEKDFKEIINKN